ncbi:MAG: DUF6062 family protein [Armatimonadota bacterium]
MHLPEIALEEALQEGECALCWLAQKQLLRRVDTLFAEHVNDPQWRQSLREGRGFCAYHADLVLSRADVLSLSIIAEDQHEPWGEEIGSWRRAMHKLYGIFAEEVHHER